MRSRSPQTVDRREIPAYPLGEAARYVRLAPATLRSWVVGRPYPTQEGAGFFRPLIRPADTGRLVLSFNNLVEAHVLRALRTEHGVSIPAVRSALEFAEKELRIDRLLLSEELRTGAGELFLDQYGELLSLSRAGQLAIRKVLEGYLERVDWGTGFPIRLYPFVAGEQATARAVVIDPAIAFGRPIVARASIATATIAERIDAGESVDDVAADYDLTPTEIEEAVVYERAA